MAASASSAAASEVVEEIVTQPFPGIELVERTEIDPANRIRVARISLCTAQVHVAATAPATSFTTPGAWADSVGVQLATNGDFFTSGPQVYGDAVGAGMPWPLAQTGNSQSGQWYYQNHGWIAFGPDWVEFNHSERTKLADAERFGVDLGWQPATVTTEIPSGTLALVSGFPELVIEGQPYTCRSPTASDCFPDRSDMRDRHPRTAMGLTEDRETFILVVVDGRDSPDSLGMYGSELATLMFDLGAWEAFNLDGGGSTAMWLEGAGYVNQPSDGSARAVANHWGVYAGPEGGQAREPGSCFVPGGCFASPLPGAEAEPFRDMPPGSYAHDEAAAMLEAGFVGGCSTDPRMFCPACAATRAEHVTMVVNAAGIDTSMPPATPTFTDVPAEHWAFAHVEAAVAAGLIEPCGAGTFCPDDPIPRATAASVVRRAVDVPDAPDTAPFDDVLPGSPFYDDVQALHGACLLPACEGTAFCPDDPALRGDAAIFIAAAFDLVPAPPCDEGGSTSGGSGDDGDSSDGPGVTSAGGSTSDGTASGGTAVTDVLPGGDRGGEGGCSCRSTSTAPPWLLALLLLVGTRSTTARRARGARRR